MTTDSSGAGTESATTVDALAGPAEPAPPTAPAEATELIDPINDETDDETGAADDAESAGAADLDREIDPENREIDPEGAPEIAPEGAPEIAPEGAKKSRKQLLEAEGDVAADFLEVLLDICDIDGDIDVDIDGDRAAVSVVDSEEGRVPRRLVGTDGKVLEALQELTRLAVQTETGERSRLMLDVAGHRAARRAQIVEVARGVITEVNAKGDQVEMEPMTAFERKIVHDEVLAAGLRSESDGVEPRRFVVVLPPN